MAEPNCHCSYRHERKLRILSSVRVLQPLPLSDPLPGGGANSAGRSNVSNLHGEDWLHLNPALRTHPWTERGVTARTQTAGFSVRRGLAGRDISALDLDNHLRDRPSPPSVSGSHRLRPETVQAGARLNDTF